MRFYETEDRNAAPPSSGSRRASMQCAGHGCRVTTLMPTRCVCNCMCCRTTSATFCVGWLTAEGGTDMTCRDHQQSFTTRKGSDVNLCNLWPDTRFWQTNRRSVKQNMQLFEESAHPGLESCGGGYIGAREVRRCCWVKIIWEMGNVGLMRQFLAVWQT
jgi:hypothetical protein